MPPAGHFHTFGGSAVPPARSCVDADRPDDPAPMLGPAPTAGADDPVPVFADVMTVEAVTAFVARSRRRGSAAAFQALLAAAEGTVRGVLAPLRAASAAAINLAQQTTVDAATAHLGAGADALHGGLSAEGLALAEPSPSGFHLRFRDEWLPRLRARAAELAHPGEAPRGPTWIGALATAVDALGGAADHLDTLALGQPEDSSARALGLGVALQLRRHRDALLADAARMME